MQFKILTQRERTILVFSHFCFLFATSLLQSLWQQSGGMLFLFQSSYKILVSCFVFCDISSLDLPFHSFRLPSSSTFLSSLFATCLQFPPHLGWCFVFCDISCLHLHSHSFWLYSPAIFVGKCYKN